MTVSKGTLTHLKKDRTCVCTKLYPLLQSKHTYHACSIWYLASKRLTQVTTNLFTSNLSCRHVASFLPWSAAKVVGVLESTWTPKTTSWRFKNEVLYLALLTTEGLLPKSSSAETLDPSTYLASIRYHTIYYAKTTIVGHPTTPILLPAASANCGILGTIQIWQKTYVPNSSFYPTVLQVVSYQKFLVMKLEEKNISGFHVHQGRMTIDILAEFGTSAASNRWQIVDFQCLNYVFSGEVNEIRVLCCGIRPSHQKHSCHLCVNKNIIL